MGINNYIKRQKIGPAEAARQIGISRQALYLVRIGIPAGRTVAKKIEIWSGGRIKPAAVIMGRAQ